MPVGVASVVADTRGTAGVSAQAEGSYDQVAQSTPRRNAGPVGRDARPMRQSRHGSPIVTEKKDPWERCPL